MDQRPTGQAISEQVAREGLELNKIFLLLTPSERRLVIEFAESLIKKRTPNA